MALQRYSGFPEKQAFMSNSYPSPITIRRDGKAYNYTCVEAAYQALQHPGHMTAFQSLSAEQAIASGQLLQPRPDWKQIQFSVMEELIRAKFDQNPDLKAQLIATRDEPITSISTSGELYWSKNGPDGENNLGRILEHTRDEYIQAMAEYPVDTPEKLAAKNTVEHRANAYAWMRHVPAGLVDFVNGEPRVQLKPDVNPHHRYAALRPHKYDIQPSDQPGFYDVRLYRGYMNPETVKAYSGLYNDEPYSPEADTSVSYLTPDVLAENWAKYGAKEATNVPAHWVSMSKDGKTAEIDMLATDGHIKITINADKILPGVDHIGRKDDKVVTLKLDGDERLPVVYTKNSGHVEEYDMRQEDLLAGWNPQQVIYAPKKDVIEFEDQKPPKIIDKNPVPPPPPPPYELGIPGAPPPPPYQSQVKPKRLRQVPPPQPQPVPAPYPTPKPGGYPPKRLKNPEDTKEPKSDEPGVIQGQGDPGPDKSGNPGPVKSTDDGAGPNQDAPGPNDGKSPKPDTGTDAGRTFKPGPAASTSGAMMTAGPNIPSPAHRGVSSKRLRTTPDPVFETPQYPTYAQQTGRPSKRLFPPDDSTGGGHGDGDSPQPMPERPDRSRDISDINFAMGDMGQKQFDPDDGLEY